MGRNSCDVRGCASHISKERLHVFPRTREKAFIWQRFCQNPKLSTIPLEKLCMKATVCRKHFDSRQFKTSACLRLNANAIPSLLPPSALLSPTTEILTVDSCVGTCTNSHSTTNLSISSSPILSNSRGNECSDEESKKVSEEGSTVAELTSKLSALEAERATLKRKVAKLWARLEASLEEGEQSDPETSNTHRKLALKARYLESRLELEKTMRAHMEAQIAQLREASEKAAAKANASKVRELAALESLRHAQRDAREAWEIAATAGASEIQTLEGKEETVATTKSCEGERPNG